MVDKPALGMKSVRDVRKITGILLLLCFLALGSGLLAHLHDLQHDRADAAIAKADGRSPGTPLPIHDENNCQVHAMIHAPALSQGWVPLLVFLGLFVAFLTMLATPLASQQSPLRLDCRGPPAL